MRFATIARGHGPRRHGFESSSLSRSSAFACSSRSTCHGRGANDCLGPQVSGKALLVRLRRCLPKLPCCLTGRSSGQPPASHLAREALTVIIHLAGQVPYQRPPLSYHVRPHKLRPIVLRASCFKLRRLIGATEPQCIFPIQYEDFSEAQSCVSIRHRLEMERFCSAASHCTSAWWLELAARCGFGRRGLRPQLWASRRGSRKKNYRPRRRNSRPTCR